MHDHDAQQVTILLGELASLLWDLEDRVQGNKPRALTRDLLAEAQSIRVRVEHLRVATPLEDPGHWDALTARLARLEEIIAPGARRD